MCSNNRVNISRCRIDARETISGFIKHIRDKKNVCFIIVFDSTGEMQVTVDKIKYPSLIDVCRELTIGSVIEASGMVVKSEFVKLNGCEMIAEEISLLSKSLPSPILAPKGTKTNIDLRLDYRWLDLRSEKNILMFRVQTEFINSFRRFLLDKDFIEIHTPKIISTESESGAGVFEVDYFGRKAYLAQSPQFYKQMAMAAGFERIFETGPVFRAEKSNSRKHSTEFSGFDLEMSYIKSFTEIMVLQQQMIIYALKNIKEKYGDAIENIFGIHIVVPDKDFPVITLQDLYSKLKDKYGYIVPEGEEDDLTTEAEKLCENFSKEEYDSEFIFVTGFGAQKRAFYHMRDENGVPCGYDLIWRGVEITTGAQREHRYEILKRQAEEKGLGNDVKDYLEFFKYGCPPHGGFGLGIDRLTLILFNSTIKEAMFLFRGPDRLTP